MKKFIKKILLFIIALLPFGMNLTSAQIAPSYEKDFASYLSPYIYNIDEVKADNTLEDNIIALFYPTGNGGILWNILKNLGFTFIVLFIVLARIKLLTGGNKADNVKAGFTSIGFIIVGALLYFGAIWILSKINTNSGSDALINSLYSDNNSILFFILSFAKAMAFIAAIIMIVVYGFKMMSNANKTDKVKTGFKGLINIIVALVIIKAIDYIYYIAQLPDLVSQATDLIIEVAKILGFIIGALMVIMLFYSGFLLITDQGNSKNMEKAKKTIVGILVAALVIFVLLLIMYEIFDEFSV